MKNCFGNGLVEAKSGVNFTSMYCTSCISKVDHKYVSNRRHNQSPFTLTNTAYINNSPFVHSADNGFSNLLLTCGLNQNSGILNHYQAAHLFSNDWVKLAYYLHNLREYTFYSQDTCLQASTYTQLCKLIHAINAPQPQEMADLRTRFKNQGA